MKQYKHLKTFLESSVNKNNLQTAWDLNKPYDWNPIPKKFKKKSSIKGLDKHYKIVKSSAIQIGEENPVKKFKEWDSQYWKPKEEL
jgi:hypothetical protein